MGEEGASGWWNFSKGSWEGLTVVIFQQGGGAERMSSVDVLGEKHPRHWRDQCGGLSRALAQGAWEEQGGRVAGASIGIFIRSGLLQQHHKLGGP